ncbi:MAG: NAD(P)H-binding protein [Bacteroidales bacterium]|nr:NAD(P)H-binding protein [Bacteroidales bacterium]
MRNKTAALIGATGLIGSQLLDLLQDDSAFTEIKILVRRPIKIDNPKVRVSIIDFSDEVSFKSEISGSSIVFCAVGTTNKKIKGDKNEYRKIDYDIPVTAAKLSLGTGCEHFVLVSSYGANSKSNNFYTSLKGEVEDTLSGLNIPSLSIFRPSLLLGKRQEFRLGESIATLLMKPLSFLLPTKMRPIKAYDVAKSMIEASKTEAKGTKIYHYKEIMRSLKK